MKTLVFLLFITLINLIHNHATVLSQELKSYEFFSIDSKNIDIKISKDGKFGPYGFSVIGKKVAFMDGNRIIVVNKKGQIEKSINANEPIGHFDLNQAGDGFISVRNELFKILNFKISKDSEKTNFSLLGNTHGRFRIDLVKENRVRFISFSPDFVAISDRDGVENSQILRATENPLISKLTYNCILFIGLYKGSYLFFDAFANKQKYVVNSFQNNSKDLIKDNSYTLPYHQGIFVWDSYGFRLDEENDCFYSMYITENKIKIRKFLLAE